MAGQLCEEMPANSSSCTMMGDLLFSCYLEQTHPSWVSFVLLSFNVALPLLLPFLLSLLRVRFCSYLRYLCSAPVSSTVEIAMPNA